jgi:amino acid transporter
MEFSFNEYYGVLVNSSIIFIVIALIILIYGVVKYFKSKKTRLNTNIKVEKGSLILVLMCFIVICSIGIATMNTSLLFEKEEDKVSTQGIISEINEVKNPAKLTYNHMQVTPNWIVINGIEYYIMYIGDFSVGDNVSIEYLPNSLIVLSIYYNN